MASKAPRENIDESKLTVTKPKTKAVGIPAVANALKISFEQMGAVRSVQTLVAVNQLDGPGFGTPLPGARTPPTSIRVGLRYRY